MKKIIRIILSPFLFIFLVCALMLFPTFLCLGMGMFNIIGNLFKDNNDDFNLTEELNTTFIGVIYPYVAAKQFIKNGTIPE